jgi:hypothetical protein
MNFLNRKMFANGGGANQGYVVLTDGSTKYYDPLSFEQQLRSLPDSELFALKNSASAGQISFSPELSVILNTVVSRKEIPLMKGTQEFIDQVAPDNRLSQYDPNYGKSQSYSSIVKDYPRRAKGIFGPALRGIATALIPEETLQSTPFLKDISTYDSPYYGEGAGALTDFRDAEARGGRSKAELDAILGGGLDQIQDFQADLNDVVDTATVTEVSGPSGPTPITTSETLSIEGGPGSLEARRLAYEKEMIGRDEFGNLLPEGRLEQDDEIATLLDEIKPIEQKVDVDKTEADTLAENAAKFGGLSQEEFRATIDDAAIPKLPEIEMPIVGASIEEQEELRKQNDPISRKLDQPGFFGSDRFLNFIRNVGGELTRTGQMGAGLASGASKAAEERAARELMADKEERDYRMKLRLAKAEADLEARNKLAEGIKPSDIKTFTGFEDDIGNALSQFDESERIVSDINQILNDDIKDPGAFGAKGFLAKINDKLRNAAGYGETKWENLDPAVKTQVILDVTAQRSVRQILGESGKTISNLDRDIVARIFGNVNIWTSPAELSKLLTNSRDNIVESMRKDQSTVISRANAIGQGGYNSPTLMANESLINRILGFSFDDIENYKLGENSAGYIETTL